MTTAHRPTYKAAVAKEDQGNNRMLGRSLQVSKEDAPHHLTTKYRQKGQNREDELDREAMKRKLLEKEEQAMKKAGRAKPINNREALQNIKEDAGEISGDEKKWEALDKDDSDSDKSSDISGDEDSDDETAELLRELEKIKKERAIEEEKKAKEASAKEEKEREDSILMGNPLLNKGDVEMGMLKRRWDDDVVFKNQTRGEPVKKKKRFINDTIRSDFHRKFLGKYIK